MFSDGMISTMSRCFSAPREPIRRIRVRLTCDLTKYMDGLVEGSEGVTVRDDPASDRAVYVQFDGLGMLPCYWQSLEIIDEEYLAEKEAERKEWFKRLKTARHVVYRTGPRGGWRSLSFEIFHPDEGFQYDSCGRRDKDEVLEFFEKNDIPVKVVVEK